MSGQSHSHLAPERSSRPAARRANPGLGLSNAMTASTLLRTTTIEQLRPWLQEQYTRISEIPVIAQIQESNAVLAFLENAWFSFEETGELPPLSSVPGPSILLEQSRVAIPMELASEVRPLIDLTEPSGAIDWNARLGIPEYRTQSDNLVGPEATCNTTTLAMILERLGYSRQDLIEAMEVRFAVNDETQEERTQVWEQKALAYINSVMNDSRAYRRIRGQASVSRTERTAIAETFREQAQLEDLLDLLLKDMGLSRYGIISEPTMLLRELSGDQAGETEIIWNSHWDTLKEKVGSCLDNGGAAALSFRHKGTRGSDTHIVSILFVEEGGFEIDDPYGDVRADYNPEKYDDAYWARDEEDNLIQSRSRQRNQAGGFDDWGVDWMMDLPSFEEKGKETFLSSEVIRKGFNYVQLFHRPNPDALP